MKKGIITGVLFALLLPAASVAAEQGLAPFSSDIRTKTEKAEVIALLKEGRDIELNVTPRTFGVAMHRNIGSSLGRMNTLTIPDLIGIVRESRVAPCEWAPEDVEITGVQNLGEPNQQTAVFQRFPRDGEQCLVHSELGVILSLHCLNPIRDLRAVPYGATQETQRQQRRPQQRTPQTRRGPQQSPQMGPQARGGNPPAGGYGVPHRQQQYAQRQPRRAGPGFHYYFRGLEEKDFRYRYLDNNYFQEDMVCMPQGGCYYERHQRRQPFVPSPW